ncbi:MAG: NAD(P)H-dependent oxidoreductase subunit E [Candidatus Goldbacteria bacterium]|nr:NAD(P)H-dependent oxidoreductase subunit E [Candidatus Goldiibacteriota bacterium]
MTTGKQAVELDANLLSFIEKWKSRPGSEIMVLHKVQEIYGYVPREVAMEVSRIIGIPLAKIYGIITFYHLFKLKKPGKNQISVCMGTACYLKGGNDLMMEIEDLLDVGINSTSPDGLFSLELVRCVGCCGLAPVMLVNGKVYGNLKKDMLPAIFAEYRKLEEDKTNG